MIRRGLSLGLCGAAYLALAAAGCSQLKLFHKDPFASIPTATPENPVWEVLCLWEPAKGTGLDNVPCRGFNGRIMFFQRSSEKNPKNEPVRVEGNIRIYVFDDHGTPEEQKRPFHEFDFDSTCFQAFLTKTELGAAYQLFIPYTRPGGEGTKCSLCVRLSPPQGRPVFSQLANVELPGSPRKAVIGSEHLTESLGPGPRTDAGPREKPASKDAPATDLKHPNALSFTLPPKDNVAPEEIAQLRARI